MNIIFFHVFKNVCTRGRKEIQGCGRLKKIMPCVRFPFSFPIPLVLFSRKELLASGNIILALPHLLTWHILKVNLSGVNVFKTINEPGVTV